VLWGPDERDWEQNLVANANDAQIRAMSRSANIVRPVANFSDEGTAHFHERALFRRRSSSPRAGSRSVTNQSRETGDVPFAFRNTTRK
jgi:hypothetical protein